MANLKNAAIRARINEAFMECLECHESYCSDACEEAVQYQLDDIIDDMRKQFGGDAS